MRHIRHIGFIGLICLIGLIGGAKTASASGLVKAPNNLGLVYYASFEDGKGTKATDFSGKGNSGTLTNMADPPTSSSGWNPGKIGKGLTFDGSNDIVTITSASSLNQTTAFTFSMWIYMASQPSNYATLLKKLSQYEWNTYGTGFGIGTGGANHYYGSLGFPYGSWAHAAFVYDGSQSNNDRIKLYLNGVLKTPSDYGTIPTSISGTSNSLYFGAYQPGTLHFPGKLDDVRMYNRALSATEVAALYGQTSQTVVKNSSRGLVGHWTFEEGTGTITADKTGNGNTGTLTNSPTWTTGKYGKGLSFDGTNDYIQIPDSSSIDPSGAIAVSFWSKINSSNPVTYPCYLGKAPVNNSYLFVYNAGAMTWRIHVGSVYDVTASTITPDVWEHWTGTYDGETMYLYKNGSVVGSNASPSGALSATAGDLFFGTCDTGLGNIYRGLLDDVRIHNRALSAQEVLNLYNSSGEALGILNRAHRDTLTSGLVGYWSFDGPTMTTATSSDSSGQGNHGSLVNGPTKTIGRLGQALRFDGADDRIGIPNFSLQGEVTGSAWLKIEQTGGGQAHIFSDIQGSGQGQYGFEVNRTAGKLSMTWNSVVILTGNASLSLNTWYHVVGVRRGSSGAWTAELYINGVIDNSVSSVATNPSAVGSYLFGIGSSPNSGGYVKGFIDEVRIYSRALSATEVVSLYNQGK